MPTPQVGIERPERRGRKEPLGEPEVEGDAEEDEDEPGESTGTAACVGWEPVAKLGFDAPPLFFFPKRASAISAKAGVKRTFVLPQPDWSQSPGAAGFGDPTELRARNAAWAESLVPSFVRK